jgi:hypothetical protein
MSKKRNTQQDRSGPDIVDVDALSSMSDDELSNRFQRLDSEREMFREQRVHTRAWEIEIAYVRREQMLRRVRRDMHDAYLSNLRSDPESHVDVLSDEYESEVSNDLPHVRM